MFWLSLYLYVPVLPLHAEKTGASLSMVGLIISSYAIAQVLLRIPLGVSADLLGKRKPFVLIAFALNVVGAIGLVLAPNPWTIFAARAITGIGAAGWVAQSVLYSSYFTPAQTGRAMARIMSVNAASLVIASLAGGLIAEWLGINATFYAGAGVGVIGMILLFSAGEPPVVRRKRYSVSEFVEVAKTPLLLTVGVIGIFVQFVSFGGSFGFVPLYAERIGANDAEVGYVMTVMLVFAVIGSLATTRVVGFVGYRGAILMCSVIVAISMGIVPMIDEIYYLAGAQALGGFGRGLLNTILISLSVQTVAPASRATGMGIYQATYSIGMLSGPIVSGVVADMSGLNTVFYVVAGVSIVGGLFGLSRTIGNAGQASRNNG
ncbi:MAG: MFS transporter [Chloroflexi bacterium]|nr:MFS transporter [Chloroflexota bacterium]